MPKVVVIGGGWAGLACATELARVGMQVRVIEAADYVGGRARTVMLGPWRVDNGQHILLGAYHDLLNLLSVVGVAQDRVLTRRALSLHSRSQRGEELALRLPALPAPLHVVGGLLTARGLSTGERLAALRLLPAVLRLPQDPADDVSVRDWLVNARQPPRINELLWEPLCIAALNTPPQRASAQVFGRVLRDAFSHCRHDADLLLPRVPLGAVFPEPAVHYIERRGGEIQLGTRVMELQIGPNGVTGVATSTQEFAADHVVLAVSPKACRLLAAGHAELRELKEQLALFQYEPICTVYLLYPEPVSLGGEGMFGCAGTLTQWLFDCSTSIQAGMVAAVISGPGAHMSMEKHALAEQVSREVAMLFPAWPAPSARRVVRERRATFSCEVGINSIRPSAATGVRGCWVAGDFTDTGYPATLEGAVRSGLVCARAIAASAART